MLSRGFGCFVDYDDLLSKKTIDNLEGLRLSATKLDTDYFENVLQDQDVIKNDDYALEVSRDFVKQMFNGKVNHHYEDFLKMAKKTLSDDEEFEDCNGFVSVDRARKRIYKVGLPEHNTFIKTTVYPHEFGHYLHCKCAAKMFDAILLREVPSILMQHLFVDYCKTNNLFLECGDLDYIYHYDSIMCFLYNRKSFIETKNLLEKEDYNMDIFMDFIETSIYYYGYAYANRLYELYLDDEKKMKKRILGLFKGAKLNDLLADYNISMQDNKTVDSTLRLIKKIK